jgi:hypothetical protein
MTIEINSPQEIADRPAMATNDPHLPIRGVPVSDGCDETCRGSISRKALLPYQAGPGSEAKAFAMQPISFFGQQGFSAKMVLHCSPAVWMPALTRAVMIIAGVRSPSERKRSSNSDPLISDISSSRIRQALASGRSARRNSLAELKPQVGKRIASKRTQIESLTGSSWTTTYITKSRGCAMSSRAMLMKYAGARTLTRRAPRCQTPRQ